MRYHIKVVWLSLIFKKDLHFFYGTSVGETDLRLSEFLFMFTLYLAAAVDLILATLPRELSPRPFCSQPDAVPLRNDDLHVPLPECRKLLNLNLNNIDTTLRFIQSKINL